MNINIFIVVVVDRLLLVHVFHTYIGCRKKKLYKKEEKVKISVNFQLSFGGHIYTPQKGGQVANAREQEANYVDETKHYAKRKRLHFAVPNV